MSSVGSSSTFESPQASWRGPMAGAGGSHHLESLFLSLSFLTSSGHSISWPKGKYEEESFSFYCFKIDVLIL